MEGQWCSGKSRKGNVRFVFYASLIFHFCNCHYSLTLGKFKTACSVLPGKKWPLALLLLASTRESGKGPQGRGLGGRSQNMGGALTEGEGLQWSARLAVIQCR